MLKKDLRKLICFMLIGDGYLNPQGYLTVQHSTKQKDYCLWKQNLIDSNSVSLKRNIFSRGYDLTSNSYPAYRFVYYYTKYIKFLRKQIYRPNKTLDFIMRQIETDEDFSLFLSLLMMDDGFEHKRLKKNKNGDSYYLSPRYQIFTSSFSKSENIYLLNFINNKLNINGLLKVQRSKHYFLDFNCNDSRIIFNVIKDNLSQIDSMKNIKFSLSFLRL